MRFYAAFLWNHLSSGIMSRRGSLVRLPQSGQRCRRAASSSMTNEFENVPGTWSYILKNHFDAFTQGCWKAFNTACEDMREKGHENKVPKMKWREYVLWDMQKKHDEEVSKDKSG